MTQISLGTFTDAKELAFETTPLGNISSIDSLFSDFGITQVTTTASQFPDDYSMRSNNSRALWASEAALSHCLWGSSTPADHGWGINLTRGQPPPWTHQVNRSSPKEHGLLINLANHFINAISINAIALKLC